uniref:Paraneoplastic antigen Ma-like C-terminal domain-containing protein n=1 Tax=Cyprinus carpio carpio TaxID=630221 RepID=A0A9J8DAD9_CYPCA
QYLRKLEYYEGIDARKAFVLSEVSLGVTDETMYKVLDEAKVFGPCKIRGRCVEHVSKSQLVLVKTINDMTKTDIPEQLLAGDEFGPWIVNVTETQSVHVTGERDFQSRLLSFLANEGKTLADVTGLLTSASALPTAPDLNTKLVNAISSLVEKCQATPVDGPGYRKVRMFSGMKPTPHGEEEYDAWAEQTTHMLDEWQCSDVVKRPRVAESLNPLESKDIVRVLRVNNPQATANDYLKALETAFGTTDSAADLMVRFRNTFQQDGEKLSAYLLRLDKLLHEVHRKGGIEVIDMNRACIDQVARGSLPHDLICDTLPEKQANLPEGLVGLSAIVSVQIEVIYVKALLDSESQVTLLYRSFYDKYLKHLPLTPIECLEIWGLSAKEYAYNVLEA